MTLTLLLLGVGILMLLRVPVAFSLLIPSLGYIYLAKGITFTIVLQRMTSGIDSFPLLAVPLFIFMGNIANQSGITDRLFNFANVALGHIRGSLGYVNVAASVVFSWMSGSAMADAAGLGKLEVPAMLKRGYDKNFSVGLTAASSVIGPIMPPSITAVVYGVVSGASIGGLFVAGIIPALLIAAVLSVWVYGYARNKPHLRSSRATRHELASAGGSAFLALLTPMIVLGGILGGVFTPTEAAGAAALYMVVLGLAYRTLKWADFRNIFVSTASTTGVVMFIVASASVFGWVLGREQVPQTLTTSILSLTDSPIVFLILLNIVLLIVGMILEPNSAILIIVPVILPAAAALDISPIHLGSVVILNLMIGLLTPPVGLVLYVLSSVTNIPFSQVARGTLPFLVPLILILILVTFIPALTMWLPSIFGLT
jgi:tripartite ATP-independent transporter DctM subunit